jgi:hypothetical protein
MASFIMRRNAMMEISFLEMAATAIAKWKKAGIATRTKFVRPDVKMESLLALRDAMEVWLADITAIKLLLSSSALDRSAE